MCFRERRHGTKCAIDVEPHIVPPGHVRQFVERVDRTRTNRAGISDDGNRPIALAPVARDGLVDQCRIELILAVDRKFAKRAPAPGSIR